MEIPGDSATNRPSAGLAGAMAVARRRLTGPGAAPAAAGEPIGNPGLAGMFPSPDIRVFTVFERFREAVVPAAGGEVGSAAARSSLSFARPPRPLDGREALAAAAPKPDRFCGVSPTRTPPPRAAAAARCRWRAGVVEPVEPSVLEPDGKGLFLLEAFFGTVPMTPPSLASVSMLGRERFSLGDCRIPTADDGLGAGG